MPTNKEVFALCLSDVVFIMLINVKMPTIDGILTFMSMEKVLLPRGLAWLSILTLFTMGKSGLSTYIYHKHNIKLKKKMGKKN